MTDSTMTEIPLVERLLKISNDEYLALGEENCCAIDEAAAMLKAAVDALEEIATELVSEEAMRSCATNTLASLKQPASGKAS